MVAANQKLVIDTYTKNREESAFKTGLCSAIKLCG